MRKLLLFLWFKIPTRGLLGLLRLGLRICGLLGERRGCWLLRLLLLVGRLCLWL